MMGTYFIFNIFLLSQVTFADDDSWWSWPWQVSEFRDFTLPIQELSENLSESPLIVNGKTAREGEFPWQVSLQKGPGRHFCGGSIIDETHVITACHCIRGQDPSRILIVAGAHNMKDANETSQQRIWAKKLFGNPKYSSWRINHDSAIIELKEPLIFNERVQPIRLAPKNHRPFGRCTTSGWGNANRFGIRPVVIPNTLQKTNTTIVPRNLCRLPYLVLVRSWITGNMICVGNGLMRGVCNGDSGGPLTCYDLTSDKKPYLAGLTSFGVPPCGQPFFPSVFANVASQRDFIDGVLGYNLDDNYTESSVTEVSTEVAESKYSTDLPVTVITTEMTNGINSTERELPTIEDCKKENNQII